MIVLSWIRKESYQLKNFVANRIATIQDMTSSEQWCYVATEDNPADFVSRGMDSLKLKTSVHLDIVTDLTSNAFIATLKRFIFRRGKCAKLYSDNATNFVGANIELKKMFNLVCKPDETLASYMASEGIDWKFLPPRAPNFGGLWEAGVKSLKFYLKRVVDDFMRGRIIGKIEEGRKITDVAREFDIAHSVVSRLWKSFKTTGMCSRRHGGGRVRRTTPAEDRYIVLSAKRNRRTTAQQHRTARLQWCREHHNWTEQDWACVLFSYESRFSLSSDCRRQLIWRESGTAYRPENIQEKDRYPTCSIMVWAGIMINGRKRLHVVANETMTGQRYIDEVLLPHVRLFRGAVGDKFVFMDDNETCHRTLAVQDCLDSEGIQRLVWQARSPDLNPIENVWEALGRQVAGRNYPPTNKNTLIRALTEEWDKLPQQLLDNVVQSRSITSIVEPDLTNLNENRLDNWQKITKIIQLIWKRWSVDYLNSLQQRNKWHFEKKNAKIGDMVIIKENNLPSCQWSLGRINNIYPGKDSKKPNSKPRTPSHWPAAARPIAMEYISSMKIQLYPISSSRLSDTGLRVPRNPDTHRTFRRFLFRTPVVVQPHNKMLSVSLMY
ncbi:transposable element Tcb2 transposase [Trichonephila clavipes]|nr:transposable element Tcb2 transposase [Trichonephila clavipes]